MQKKDRRNRLASCPGPMNEQRSSKNCVLFFLRVRYFSSPYHRDTNTIIIRYLSQNSFFLNQCFFYKISNLILNLFVFKQNMVIFPWTFPLKHIRCERFSWQCALKHASFRGLFRKSVCNQLRFQYFLYFSPSNFQCFFTFAKGANNRSIDCFFRRLFKILRSLCCPILCSRMKRVCVFCEKCAFPSFLCLLNYITLIFCQIFILWWNVIPFISFHFFF